MNGFGSEVVKVFDGAVLEGVEEVADDGFEEEGVLEVGDGGRGEGGFVVGVMEKRVELVDKNYKSWAQKADKSYWYTDIQSLFT